MYENQTYEAILERALDAVPSNINKIEGSIIYNALAPACAEIAKMYIELDALILNTDLSTAGGTYLTNLCYQHGVPRKPATYAKRKGEFNVEVPLGSRFRLEDSTYTVLSHLSGYNYILQCEQAGEIGNIYTGAMTAISYVEELDTLNLTDILSYGEEEENDESLRSKMKSYLTDPSQDGTSAQYKQWAMEYSGVGTAKVVPLWNGGNTVKVVITNSFHLPADSTLISEVQEYMDPNSEGLGNGMAPIGSKVTVTGGTQKNISISGKVVLADGYTEPEGASDAVANYLASLVFSKLSISYMRIGSALLDCDSIAEVSNLTINGATSDITLQEEEIPVLVNLSLTVVTG